MLWTVPLHAQWLHFGFDGVLGIHYNTLNGASYKRPIGIGGGGVHITFSDPDDPQRAYFNGRLTVENDFQTDELFPGTSLDLGLRDLICSFQACKKLNEKLAVYAGLNLALNLFNTAHYRSGASAFFTMGEGAEAMRLEVREKIRKLNAGIEGGFSYPLGSGFNVGLNLTYYVLKRFKEDINVDPSGVSGSLAWNFRPLALRMLVTFDVL